MNIKTRFSKCLATAALLCLSGASHAAITVYTTEASFLAAVSTPGVDTFTDFSITGNTPSPIYRSAGAYRYTAAVVDSFFGAGTTSNPWLSTNLAADPITFNWFTGSVRAIGGNFFGSNIGGMFAAGSVTLTATDASGRVTQTIAGATTSSFMGFVSNRPIRSLVVSAVQPTSGIFLWATVDNLTLALPGAVPATQLAFGQQPTTTASGASITPAVSVRILDAGGNLVNSSANVTLAIATNPSSGTLSGTPTQAAVAGVATFSNLSINIAGMGYTFAASSGALTGATSNASNINAATPHRPSRRPPA